MEQVAPETELVPTCACRSFPNKPSERRISATAGRGETTRQAGVDRDFATDSFRDREVGGTFIIKPALLSGGWPRQQVQNSTDERFGLAPAVRVQPREGEDRPGQTACTARD